MSILISSDDNSNSNELPQVFSVSKTSVKAGSVLVNKVMDLTQDDDETENTPRCGLDSDEMFDQLISGKRNNFELPSKSSQIDTRPITDFNQRSDSGLSVLSNIDLTGTSQRSSKTSSSNSDNGTKARCGKIDLVEKRSDSGISTGSVDLIGEPSASGFRKGKGRRRRKSVDAAEVINTKKTSKAQEKEVKRLKLAEEKAAKQATSEFNKIYKPAECMKYMSVEIHPELLSAWYMGDVSREVDNSGAKVTTSPQLWDTRLVMWTRTLPRTLANTHGQLQLTPSQERCSRALYIMTAEDVAALVVDHTLAAHVQSVKSIAMCAVTVAIFGIKDYFKSKRLPKNQKSQKISEIDLEMAIADLLISADSDAVKVNSSNELALLIVQFTKAIAEAPHKLSKRVFDDQAEFYMRGDNKKCVTVDKDGHGLSRLWQQMIAVLPLSSLETARAVCGQYSTPFALYEALKVPDGVKQLADVGVARAAVPGSKSRRLGPEFAKKLRILFTAEDGSVLVD